MKKTNLFSKMVCVIVAIMALTFNAQAQIQFKLNPTASTVASTNPSGCGLADGTIQVAGGNSYLWSDGQITATASALVAGSYTVDLTALNGCVINYAPVALVDPGAPAVVLASNDADNTVCATTLVTYTITIVPGATNYTFFVNGVSAQSGLLNTYAYTPANTDVVTASVTLAGCTGASAPIAMIVNALPVGSTVASSNPTSCGAADGSIQVAGGASYLWSDGQITATASALVQGAYTVDITSASGCVTTYAPAALSDPGAPAAVLASNDADNTVCAGTSVTYTTTVVPGATNYTFFVNGVSAQSGLLNTYAYAPANGDVVTSSVTLAGCTGNSVAINMIVNALPTATFAAAVCVNAGSTQTAIVTPVGGTAPYSVQITSGMADLVLPNNTNPVIGIPAAGTATFSLQVTVPTYNIRVTDANGCFTNY